MNLIFWAALIRLAGGAVAAAQQGAGDAAYTATIAAVCRGYAAAQTGMPAGIAFAQCLGERHCRAAPAGPGYRCQLPAPVAGHGGGL